jgi:epsilon-lactone hydrolase
MSNAFRIALVVGLAATLSVAPTARAQANRQGAVSAAVTIDEQGTVNINGVQLPLSEILTPEAKAAFLTFVKTHYPAYPNDASRWRREIDEILFKPNVADWRAAYPVIITEQRIAGVRTDIVTPQAGIDPANRKRVLMALHGGGFMLGGGGPGGQAEAIPLAGIGKVKVIAVDYRMYPEARHPAGVEDAVAVYRELLKTYKPENIGIYGCSSGGVLAGQTTASIQKQNLPRPGAIVIACDGATKAFRGDSTVLGNVMTGQSPPLVSPERPLGGYFQGADPNDPIVFPAEHPDVIAKFPPTLVLTGTRDINYSTAIHTHALLRKVNVDAQLYVMEGLGHGQHVSLGPIPEAIDANTEMWKFFNRHLGRK